MNLLLWISTGFLAAVMSCWFLDLSNRKRLIEVSIIGALFGGVVSELFLKVPLMRFNLFSSMSALLISLLLIFLSASIKSNSS